MAVGRGATLVASPLVGLPYVITDGLTFQNPWTVRISLRAMI
jgi:hypothetical protein